MSSWKNILNIRVCHIFECGTQFLPKHPNRVQKYCSLECAKRGRQLTNKEAKARYLHSPKGRRAKKKENACYRHKIDWSEYMTDYRAKKDDVKGRGEFRVKG